MVSTDETRSWGREMTAKCEVDYPLSSFPKFCHKVMKYSFAYLGITPNIHPLVDDES